MAGFYIAIPKILEHEGGLVNNPNDPGGPTNHGISLRYLTKRGDLLGDFDGDGDVDIDDIMSMTVPQAQEVYLTGFWNPNQLSKVKSQLLATKIFDMCVNMGSKQAWKIAQRAMISHGKGLQADGIVGPKTLRAINSLEKTDFLVIITIREMQKKFYEGIIENNPKFQTFALGWFRRSVF